jgi:hypothetical protein
VTERKKEGGEGETIERERKRERAEETIEGNTRH